MNSQVGSKKFQWSCYFIGQRNVEESRRERDTAVTSGAFTSRRDKQIEGRARSSNADGAEESDGDGGEDEDQH